MKIQVKKLKITPKIINWLELLAKAPPKKGEGGEGGFFLAPYMEYPTCKKCKYVMQHHWRGASVHTDWRMEVNDHLIGWTVLDNPKGTPTVTTVKEARKVFNEWKSKFKFRPEKKNIGLRAETKCPSEVCDEWTYSIKGIKDGQVFIEYKNIEKLSLRTLEELARQPKVWLNVEGIVKPGEVGATKEYPGVFYIIDKGQVYFGAQKPYFHEYFIKSEKKDGVFSKKDWTRVIVRAVNVNIIDPETKKPKPGTELMWRILIPGDQTPYCLKRGMKKKWVPPKNYIPVPPEWRKGELYEKWYEWVKEQWKGGKKSKESKSELAEASFVVHYLSWMGPVHVRGIPRMRWLLRLKEGGKVRSFISDYDFTRFQPVPLTDEGYVASKWFDYEGEIKPGENPTYNPTKELNAKMKIIDKGKVNVKSEKVNGTEKLILEMKGKKLKGTFALIQEEKGSKIYTWKVEKLSNLKKAKFVLQIHEIETPEGLKKHWDVRVSDGWEFNLYGNPVELEKGEGVKAVYKRCLNIEKWMNIKKPKTKMMIGNLITYVTPIDEGDVSIIEYKPPIFISMEFHGKKLKGYYVYIEKDKEAVFKKAKLPEPLSGTGDPTTGDYYRPFKVEKKKTWDYYWLYLYDIGEFTRCVKDPEKYIPALKDRPKEVLDVLVCLYPRPGTIHGARVCGLKISEEWSVDKASEWIRKNKLHTWEGELIREQRKKTESELEKEVDSAVLKILKEIERKASEKDTEEEKLKKELLKKKLELIEKWLEVNKE